jgi:hypothetical protein
MEGREEQQGYTELAKTRFSYNSPKQRVAEATSPISVGRWLLPIVEAMTWGAKGTGASGTGTGGLNKVCLVDTRRVIQNGWGLGHNRRKHRLTLPVNYLSPCSAPINYYFLLCFCNKQPGFSQPYWPSLIS